MLYIFGKLGASSKQWFVLYFISSEQENVLGIKHKLILPFLYFPYLILLSLYLSGKFVKFKVKVFFQLFQGPADYLKNY